jgi:hypothetical protein
MIVAKGEILRENQKPAKSKTRKGGLGKKIEGTERCDQRMIVAKGEYVSRRKE